MRPPRVVALETKRAMERRLVNIQNVGVDNLTQEEVFQYFEIFLQEPQQRLVFFANAHVVNVARKDIEFRTILAHADLVLPDGIGLRMAGRILNTPIRANLCGTDLIPKILGYAGVKGLRVFLLGACPGVAEEAAQRLRERLPLLSIVGWHHGYFSSPEAGRIVSLINQTRPDILLVAMGVPLQEKWIHRFFADLNARLFFGVGAFLDFQSGNVPRAPFYLRERSMEWIYRFWQEPRRMWRRYLIGNATFLFNTARQRLGLNGWASNP